MPALEQKISIPPDKSFALSMTLIISDSLDINEFNVPLNYKVISNKALIRKMEEVFGGFEY